MKNAVWLGLGVALAGLGSLASLRGQALQVAGFGIAVGVLVVGLVVPLLLIGNGVVMVRREGFRLPNLLSFLAGVGLLLVGVVFLVGVGGSDWTAVLAGGVVLLSAYGGFLLASLLGYALLYARIGRGRGYDVIVVCGAGLAGDRVPPLLAGRLDRAARVYREEGTRPLIVVSGGKGPGETRTEGEAMRDYLLDAGLPAEDVAVEDKARNTEENLRLGSAVAHGVGRTGPAVAVTSNYHALRTASLARSLGLAMDVTGARTAAYFLPSAFLREVAALVVRRWYAHAIACALLLAGYAVLLLENGWV